MEWNVYIYSINRNKIEPYNIFNHWSFVKDIKKHIKKYKYKDELSEKIKYELLYYFWSKCEWELIIEITEDNRIFLNPWVGCRNPEEVRIDVTDDASFDWRSFAEYHISKQIYNNEAKIDVFNQIMFNYDSFIDYCWEHKKEIE